MGQRDTTNGHDSEKHRTAADDDRGDRRRRGFSPTHAAASLWHGWCRAQAAAICEAAQGSARAAAPARRDSEPGLIARAARSHGVRADW